MPTFNQTINTMKTTCINPLYLLLATLFFGVTACGLFNNDDDSEEEVEDICSNPEFFDFEPKNGFAIGALGLSDGVRPWKWDGTGDETNLDVDLGIIYLASPSEGPDDEAIGTLTFLFNQPNNGIPDLLGLIDLSGKCISKIQSVTLSSSDVRRGTGPEINGKLFMGANTTLQADVACTGSNIPSAVVPSSFVLPPGYIEFFYLSGTRAYGWFCSEIEQVSPVSGDPFLITGVFKIQTQTR